MKRKFKRDQYMSARGGTSTFYNVYCAHCRRWVLLYQKDGKGNLFRLYLDRIHAPDNLASLPVTDKPPATGLSCPHCGESIGVPMIYKPESRPAFRLIPGGIVKKKSDGTLPAPETAEPKKEGSDEDSAS
jgi:hypothetical protein